MPVPKPDDGENERDFISRCMGDEAMASEYEQEQRAAICHAQWREGKSESAGITKLVDIVRGRKSAGEFGYGITTADRYVRKALEECGHILYGPGTAAHASIESAIKDSESKLVYAVPGMVMEQAVTSSCDFKSLMPSGVEVPEHTAMVNVHVLTTPAEDRDGDTLRTEGALLDPKAPSLWQHLHTSPVGKILGVVEHTKDKLRVVSAVLDINELTNDVVKLIEAGVLRFSHGFIAKEWAEKKAASGDLLGFDVSKFEILEESYVSVPSNYQAEIELWSRGKLASDMMKAHAKAKFDARQKVFRGTSFDSQATKADVSRWNKSINEAPWDVPLQKLEPSTLVYDWYSKFCGVEIKKLAEIGNDVGSVRMGAWLTAMEDWKATSGCTIADVRNISSNYESPPGYEEILLNSKRKARFLVDGTIFLHDATKRPFLLTLCRVYYGLRVTLRCRRDDLDAALDIRKWIEERAATYKFLKGEKFSLTGEFLEPTGEKFADVFLGPDNTKSLVMSAKLLNTKADKMPCRGVMMLGPPGTGKTMSGRALMMECKDATFIWVAAKDFYRSGTFGGICGALELARELTPSIVFIEDVDNWMDGHGVDLMKSELDGIARHRGVLTILTTNYPERMDKALIDRPGRFHDVLLFDLPDEKIRRRMLDTWMVDADERQRGEVSKKTAGWSGAHLYELCQFAKTLQETEAMAPGDALAKSIEKIEQQRKLIDSVQLQGSHYSPRHSRSLHTGGIPLVAMQPPDSAPPAAAASDKAGRMLSAANIATLKEVCDDMTELADMDIPRPAKAMVERCARKLTDLLKTAVGEEAAAPTIKEVVAVLKPDLQAVVEFMLACTEPERQKVLHTLMTLLRVGRMDELAEQYRVLIQA